MSNTQIKAAAKKIANHFYFIDNPSCLHTTYQIRSMTHGGIMGHALTLTQAERKIVKWSIGTMRHSKSASGLAKQLNAIIGR